MEPIQCIHIGFQRSRSYPTISRHGETWGFSRYLFQAELLNPGGDQKMQLNRHQKQARTMLDARFVAAVLEGFEGTLDEVLGRVASPDLDHDLAVLQAQINALRVSREPPEAES
jgi:hypothetical protein